jgi:hypothetical protein
MAQTKGKRHPSYDWVWKVRKWPEAKALSREGREGIYYAEKLALNARQRSRGAFWGLARLTISQLARDQQVSPTTIRGRIRQAQIELFGRELSRSGIHHRLQRRKLLGDHRPCAEVTCDTALPLDAPAHRRYCDQHRAAAARVARYRRRRGVSGRLLDGNERGVSRAQTS